MRKIFVNNILNINLKALHRLYVVENIFSVVIKGQKLRDSYDVKLLNNEGDLNRLIQKCNQIYRFASEGVITNALSLFISLNGAFFTDYSRFYAILIALISNISLKVVWDNCQQE